MLLRQSLNDEGEFSLQALWTDKIIDPEFSFKTSTKDLLPNFLLRLFWCKLIYCEIVNGDIGIRSYDHEVVVVINPWAKLSRLL